MLRILIVLAMSYVSVNAKAAYVWEIQGNYIEEVSVFSDNPSGTYYNVISVKLKNPISTGCAKTDSTRTLNYWLTESLVSSTVTLWLSALMSAQAQGSKVDIQTDNAVCSGVYGRKLRGVRIRTD